MAESFPTGRFVWYELLTTDTEAAKEFYRPLTGWTNEVWEGGGKPYTMWMTGDRGLGGIMELPPEAQAQGAPPNWLAYIATPDVDATVQQALELGAETVVEAMEIPTVGTMSILKDPQGAVFAVYTPETAPPGISGPPEAGDFSWHELLTSDPEAGFSFYRTLFGWQETDTLDMGEMGLYRMYGRPGEGFPLGGIYKTPPQIQAPPHWLLYIKVPEMAQALKTVKAQGGQVLNGPEDVPGGDMVAQCLDPQGAAFALHAPGAGG